MKSYPKYKSSGVDWLGEIPSDWKAWKVCRLFKSIGSGTTPKAGTPEYYENGTIPWINTGDLNDGFISNCSNHITQKAFDEHSALKFYDEGTLIVAMYGATIGKTAITKFKACTNQACCSLVSSPIINIEFAFYWFIANKENIVNLSYGGGQPNISQDVIRALKIPVCNITEQQQIVNFLDYKTGQCDRFISNRQKQIELLNEQKAAIINKAVTKGINPNAKMKPSGIDWIGDIPEHWRTSRLKMFSKIYSGGTPDTKEKEYWENGTVPWIASGEVNQELITTPTTFITEEALKNSSAKWIPKNAIVMALAGQGKTKGTVSLTGIEVTGNQSLAAIVPKNINSKYLYYWLKSKYQDIRGLVGEDRDGLNLDLIGSIVIPIPSLSEQEKTTIYIEKEFNILDNLISKYQKQIELMQEYHTALISQAVTGKIDVRDWKPQTK
jgi:type I restriction enzyme S subunit